MPLDTAGRNIFVVGLAVPGSLSRHSPAGTVVVAPMFVLLLFENLPKDCASTWRQRTRSRLGRMGASNYPHGRNVTYSLMLLRA